MDATSWTNQRGFGRFTRNVVPRLVAADQDAEYLLYVDEQTAENAELPDAATVRRVRLAESPTRAAAAGSSRRVGDLLRLAAAVRSDKPDSFLFPSVYTYFPVLGVPTVLGVHDAITRELPKLTLSSHRDRLAWRAKEGFALRKAAAVFTVSEASKRALVLRFGLDPRLLRVVPEAPDDVFFPRENPDVEKSRAAFGLNPGEPYFVFAGGVSPHKNLETLVYAYASLRHMRHDAPRLLVVGDLTNDSYLSSAGTIRALVSSLDLDGPIVFTGYVTDESLAALYSGAAAVVIPSLAEGFGLPAVEGAACGAPMILSDLPAHRETLDGAALFFPARDAGALQAAMASVLEDPAMATAFADRGRLRATSLSWDAAVDPLRALLWETSGRSSQRTRSTP